MQVSEGGTKLRIWMMQSGSVKGNKIAQSSGKCRHHRDEAREVFCGLDGDLCSSEIGLPEGMESKEEMGHQRKSLEGLYARAGRVAKT